MRKGLKIKGKSIGFELIGWLDMVRAFLLSLGAKMTDWFQEEQIRWFLFLPIFLALGIGFYFSLSQEPSSFFAWSLCLASLALLLCFGLIFGFDHLAITFFIAAFVFTLGFLVIQQRSLNLAQPKITAITKMDARVLIKNIDMTRERKAQYWLVEPLSLIAHPHHQHPTSLPRLLRIKVKPFADRADFQAGDEAQISMLIYPQARSALPDGYDFSIMAWFRKIGGQGVALENPILVKHHLAPSFSARLDRLRNHIARQIDKVIVHAGASGVTIALMVGKRGFIPERIERLLRDMGLAHILAISGLHMATFAGTVYFIIRAFLALFPFLVLRFEIKKWAVIPAFLVATLYLILSGGSIATQRAFIMLAVAFGAVLLGANILTMRNVAIAALLILLATPENLLSAGFQLSFAATIAIIALYESISLPLFKYFSKMGLDRLVRGGLALILTSIVAWAATAPLTLYHFHRLGFLSSLIANFAVLPIFALCVMPLLILIFPLMLFDSHRPILLLLGELMEGLFKLIEGIGASLGMASIIAPPPFYLFWFYLFGFLWLCLWRGTVRFFGAGVLALALLASFFMKAPAFDLIISSDGQTIAARGDDGRLYPSNLKNSWLVKEWLRNDGDGRSSWQAYEKGRFSCHANHRANQHGFRFICSGHFQNITILQAIKSHKIRRHPAVKRNAPFQNESFKDLCDGVDIVIGADICPIRRLYISDSDLRYFGVHGVIFGDEGFEIYKNKPKSRLWNRPLIFPKQSD